MIIPQAHDEDHSLGEGLGHLRKTALLLVNVLVTKGGLLGAAKVRGQAVARVALDSALRVGDYLAVLNVEALDLAEGTVGALEKLGDDCHLFGRVDGEALSVEGAVALAVRVEVAAVGVAGAGVAVARVGAAAFITRAAVLAYGLAGMGCVSS